MAGFATVDSIVSAWTVSAKGQKLFFSKISAAVTIANNPKSLWTATGMPIAGTYGSVGKANGRVLTDASVGGIPFDNPGGSLTTHLISAEGTVITAAATGSLILVDRIADCLLAHAEATGSITGLDATSRLAAAGGCQIWCEVQTNFSAGANGITFTYTNSAGTGSKTTPTMTTTASALVGNSVRTGQLWVPLASGDTGVRSIQSVTLASGTATGQYAACLVRPLATIPLGVVGVTTARDFVVELPNMERIYDDSCLSLIWIPTGAQTPAIFGEVRICSA